MLSLKYIRDNIDLVRKSIQSKNIDFDLEQLLNDDKSRRAIIQKVELLKSERNLINKKISSSEDVEKNISIMREISKDIKELDFDLNTLISKINNDLLYIPNIIHNSVPIGKDESSNEIIREWGEKPQFNFEIKGHSYGFIYEENIDESNWEVPSFKIENKNNIPAYIITI